MSKRYDQSETRPFKSIYKEGYITPADYIVELIFQRRSEFNHEALPQSFWNSSKFKHLYVMQIIHTKKLLTRVDASCVLKAFKQTKACSILNKELVSKAEQFQMELEQTQKIVELTPKVELTKPSKYGKTNRLTEL